MNIEFKLQAIEKEFLDIEERMGDPATASDPRALQDLGKKRAQLEPVVEKYRAYRAAVASIAKARDLLKGGDPEIAELAREELSELEPQIENFEKELTILLLPKDPNDEKSVIVEIRAGVGGDEAALFAADLYHIDSDVARMDGVLRNSTRMRALMRAYARHVSTRASQTTIAADLAVNDGAMAPNTVSDYLDALSRAYVVEDLPAWNPALRSKTAIRTSPTRHFVDPSIGAAVMRWTPADLLRDFEAFGLQFESLCVRDLRVYAEAIDGTVFHYRDKTGLEADAVIVLADGRWAPIEVELGSRQLDEAATHLRRLRERVNADRMGEPSFLAVVTAGVTAYRRDDGVLVIPLACLRP